MTNKLLVIGCLYLNVMSCLLLMCQLLKSFAGLGPPKEDNEEECSIMHGLTSAVQCLREPASQNSKNNQTNKKLAREGRIICITNMKRFVLSS